MKDWMRRRASVGILIAIGYPLLSFLSTSLGVEWTDGEWPTPALATARARNPPESGLVLYCSGGYGSFRSAVAPATRGSPGHSLKSKEPVQ